MKTYDEIVQELYKEKKSLFYSSPTVFYKLVAEAYADQQVKQTIELAKNKVKGLRESVPHKEYGKTYFDIAYGSVIMELELLKIKQP